MMENVVKLSVPPPTAADEEFSVLIKNDLYTVRRKGDYPYRLVLSNAGVQLFVLPIEYPLGHVNTAIMSYIAGRDRGHATGRNELRETFSRLMHMENVP
jgi:hypothetical protein